MLVSLVDMKSFLGESTTTYDSFLTNQLELISATVEGYCNRRFAQTQYVQTIYAEDEASSSEITCYHFPIISVDNIVEKTSAADLVGTPVLNYRTHLPTAKLIKGRGDGIFFNSGSILEVTYTAGYAVIPAPVLSVVYSLVQERYNKKTNGIDLAFGSDVQSIAIPGVINIQYDFSLNNNERKSAFGVILGSNSNILDFYRSERSVVGSIKLAYLG